MKDYFFKFKTLYGTDIEILRDEKTITYFKIRSCKTGEEVRIDYHTMKNIASLVDRSFEGDGVYQDYKSDNNDVPEGYLMVIRPFLGLPPGTLLKKEDGYIILPFEPYLLDYDDSLDSYFRYPS